MAVLWQDEFAGVTHNLSTHTPDVGGSYSLVSGAVEAIVNAGVCTFPAGAFSVSKYDLVGLTNRTVRIQFDFRCPGEGAFAALGFQRDPAANIHASFLLKQFAAELDCYSNNWDYVNSPNIEYDCNTADLTAAANVWRSASVIISDSQIVLVIDGVVILRNSLPATAMGLTPLDLFFQRSGSSMQMRHLLVSEAPLFGGNGVLTLKSGQWNVHREGMAEVLKGFGQALCDATALALTAHIRLFTSANAPGCADAAADYTEAAFTGYAAKLIDPAGAGCTDLLEFGVDADGRGQIIVDQQAFTVGSPVVTAETVNGAYLTVTDGASEKLLGTLLFDTPVAMGVAGDILKVSGNLLFDCQMVPVA